MARRPRIVVPARFSASASALRYRADVAATKLVHAVYEAGGEPLVLHPVVPPGIGMAALDELVRDRIGMADGVLLPGGGDLAAHWAGQRPHHTEYDVDLDQDAFDLALARVALADAIPLLAVCRGLQAVNVIRGGTLVQDMVETLGADHRHLVHDVKIEVASPLAAIVAGEQLTVSCYHHQGIDRLGTGLRAVAHAADGTAEAAVIEDRPGWFLGVQWHPEDTADTDPHQSAIFRALVAASRR
jgi:putative glutamine amidotransferase